MTISGLNCSSFFCFYLFYVCLFDLCDRLRWYNCTLDLCTFLSYPISNMSTLSLRCAGDALLVDLFRTTNIAIIITKCFVQPEVRLLSAGTWLVTSHHLRLVSLEVLSLAFHPADAIAIASIAAVHHLVRATAAAAAVAAVASARLSRVVLPTFWNSLSPWAVIHVRRSAPSAQQKI